MEASSQVPEAILKLVEKYEFHQAAYKRGQFNETQLRREFIDPFFRTLGWDVDNTQGNSELYKEVIHEDPIRIRGSTEFIDYAFRIGGSRKFIVEAKKPAVNIKDDAGPALQIRRYAWNARLPLSILTDFEEFAVYDCTKKPMPSDNAATARVAYFTFKEYPEKWGWIESIFSQKSILRGSFDKFAEGAKGKKGTATVDEAILAEIEEWRDLLAKNIALRNATLSVEELNVAVQKTIDRILFLRICEDRGIEEYGCLQKLLEGQDVYQRLLTQFHRADTRYNSGIFHFNAEAGWDEMPDTLTPGLVIDDVVLKKIIKRLYYPESPYEFSVISPVILGQVYEQFLGKVIRLTTGHQAKVEYKPEVKKAGGVYYTPQYIVDYIVLHTVGELVKDKTPREVGKLRILDPACGSGSFLLGAYQFLLDWHLNWYIHNLVPVIAEKSATSSEVQVLLPEQIPKTGKKKSAGDTSLPIYKSANGSSSRTRSDWKLTIAERKRILLNNIYGVDIDTQAVEVTKLSLLLKVLEEENQENISKQLKLFEERALPSLHQNIKCGNSLIGTDIYADMLIPLDDPEVVKRINAFDWDREFPEIIRRGGFDAVIGNPPYGANFTQEMIEYIRKKFMTDSKSTNSYEIFLVQSSRLLNNQGLLSMIIPFSWLTGETYLNSRKLLISILNPIILLGMPFDVFENAYIDTAIVVFSHNDEIRYCKIHYFPKKEKLNFIPEDIGVQVKNTDIITDPMIRFSPILSENTKSILIKLGSSNIRFGTLFKIQRGVQPYSRSKHTEKQITEKFLHSDKQLTQEYLPELQGNELSRYFIAPNRSSFIRYCDEIASIRDISMFQGPRIVLRRLLTRKFRLQANYVDQPMITTDNVLNIVPINGGANLLNALGILNSKIISWLYVNTSTIAQKDDFPQVHISALKELPIPNLNENQQFRMVALVERMISLHQQRAEVKTDHEKNLIERQIEANDKQIDTLVYEMFGLTQEEIKIVEESRN